MRNIYLYLTSNDLSGAINDENVCALGNILNGLKSGGGGKAFSARIHHHHQSQTHQLVGGITAFCLDRVSTIAVHITRRDYCANYAQQFICSTRSNNDSTNNRFLEKMIIKL